MSGAQPEPHRCKHGCERDALKDDVAKLRAALDRIAERTSSDDLCRPLVQVARDALRDSASGPRARSDFLGHVLVRIGTTEFGMDLAVAIRLQRDLGVAIDNAAGFD